MSTIKSSNEHLTLNADGSSKDIKFQANGVEKASISSAGVLSSAGGSTHADNVKANFGTGNDLQIYHDGSNSYIRDAGDGDIHIRSDAGFRVQNAGGTENYIYAESNGKVRLYHNNNTKLDTTATGIDVTGAITVNGAALTSGISEADQWRLTSNVTLGNDLVSILSANWERADTDGAGKLGTGLSVSNGIFSFPSTGLWMLIFNVNGHIFDTNTRYYNAEIHTTVNNSSFDPAALAQTSGYDSGNVATYFSASCNFIFDVTNVSTHKFRMQVISIAGGFVESNTNGNRTSITAVKLGET